MKQTDIKQILKYYLEYEIYNLANSSQLKIDNKNCALLKDLQQEISNNLNTLKEKKIIGKIEKFVGKKVKDKKQLISMINKELINLNEEQSNQVQVAFRISSLIKENLEYSINEKALTNFLNELCNIKANKEFWLYAHNLSYLKNQAKKLPIFIFKCKFDNEKIDILEVNFNAETLNTILSIVLNKEISDVSIEYKEQLLNYSKEIKMLIDTKNIEQILDLYYLKLEEFVGISKIMIKNIHQKNSSYRMNEEYVIALDVLEGNSIKYIKEDIELLNKLINNDNYVPNLLKKYLIGTENKKNINNDEYTKIYRGNYKSNFGIGQNQYRIVNTINYNDLIAIEGPPGTGKTSLLKEIIANKIVERADLILKNWNEEWNLNKYYETAYYNVDWFTNDNKTIKSIVVSSKNTEAIENVGKEINKEIKYIYPIARKYKRTKSSTKEKEKQNYKGMVCLPLGKQDNIQDFKDFLYKNYIPMLNKLHSRKKSKEIIEKVKENYINKRKEICSLEKLLKSFDSVKDEKYYFYGIQISSENKDEKQNLLKKEKIKKLFNEDKNKTNLICKNLIYERKNLLEQIQKEDENLKNINKNLNDKEEQIKDGRKVILKRVEDTEKLSKQKQELDKISKNIFTKLLNYKQYKEFRNINFSIIKENEIENKIDEEMISQYIKDKSELEKKQREVNFNLEKLNEKYNKSENDYEKLKDKLREFELIEEFNNQDKNTFWDYSNSLERYGKSSLNDLNQELFQLALKLNEAYIIKNSKEIIKNLELFLQDDNTCFIGSKFYDSENIYNAEKRNGIKCLWNTLFLCFPVVTTTLDSFSKKYFHLIPEYIDLELIDEAGQILPHNLVSAIYRAKKAVIVGDINQIEPIYNNVNKDFAQNKKSIGEIFENIKVESNSIQALANKNTDILSDSENIMLNDHYRCEKNIINFSNENVYQSKLNMHIEDEKNKPFLNNMVAFDVRGKNEENKNLNRVELQSCIETVKCIKEQNKEKVSIAIITPFKNQKVEIEKELNKNGMEDVKVGTVHAFQGQERDYIIFSPAVDTIEKKWAIDFIGKKCNMLNVAVTRAKKQFIYIGNLDIAMKAENYIEKLIKYIGENGVIYSLYDIEDSKGCNNLDEKILKILQPELEIANDNIGLYIKQNIKNGVIIDAKDHYDFLRYAVKNAKKEIFIMSPWIRENVINEEFLEDIKKLKQINCMIKVIFGYKSANKNISNVKELVNELKRTSSLGFAEENKVEKIIEEMYKIIGKENFIYNPPTHAKILIIDDKYMCIGSHNWLSNAGKTNEKQRAKEGTKITTSKYAIDYIKEELFCKKLHCLDT